MSIQVCPICGATKPIKDGEGNTYEVPCPGCSPSMNPRRSPRSSSFDDEIMSGGGLMGAAERLGDRLDRAMGSEKEVRKSTAPSIQGAVQGRPARARQPTGTNAAQPQARKTDALADMLVRAGLSEKDARTAEKAILVVILAVLAYYVLKSYGIL